MKKKLLKEKALIAQNPLSLRQKLRHSPLAPSLSLQDISQRGEKYQSYGESKGADRAIGRN